MKITVTLQNLTKFVNLEIDDKNNEALLNGNKIDLDIPQFASKLLTIVSSWEETMVNYFIIDGESYSVKVEKDGKVYNFEGRNKFPKNYRDFTNLLKTNGIC